MLRSTWSLLTLLTLATAEVCGGENAALAVALADLRAQPAAEQLFTRYVMMAEGHEREDFQAVALTVNYLSLSQIIHRPEPVAGGSVLLARVNLKRLAVLDAQINQVVKTWEQFQFDPRFNLLLTRDTLRFALGQGVQLPRRTKLVDVLVPVPPSARTTGNPYAKRWGKKAVEVTEIGEAEVVRVVSEHIDKGLIAELIERTQSQAPVVSHPYFLVRALSTIQDKGLFQVLYGGLYYDLSNTPKAGKKGTDEDALFKLLGVGDVDKGISAKQLYDQTRSDQRVAMFRSAVTGKPRQIEFLKTLTGRDAQGLLVVTHDLKRQDIDIGTHPVMNLIAFKDAARELIYERPNGLHGFALYDGAGKLQEAAPSDVVVDRTVPSPHSTDLHGAISCIRCHAGEGGWRLAANDVKKLTDGRFEVLADQNLGTDIYERLAGLYAGDLERKVLPRGRDDYAAAVLRVTGPWKASKDQLDVVKLSGARIASIYHAYLYDTVDARRALAELGVKCGPKEDAAVRLQELLPPVLVVLDGVVREDPRIAALMQGLALNRAEFDLVRAFMATRLQRGEKKS